MEKKNKGRKIRRGSFIFLVFLIVYIPSMLHWIYGKSIDTDIIRIGTLEDSYNAVGYIIRDSDMYKSPFEGKYIPEAEEGERVPANYRIATVLKKSSIKLLEDMEKINLKIIEAQNEKNENRSFFSEDLAKLEREIGKKVSLVIKESSMNSLAGVKQLERDINGIIQKKAMIIGDAGAPDAHTKLLIKEKEELQEQINTSTKDVISDAPGIVSYVVDEYEEILTPDGIDKLTPKFLDSIKTSHNPADIRNKDVAAGKSFAKVIRGNEFYIASVLDKKDANHFNVNDSVLLRINDFNLETNCSVAYKSEEMDGKIIIVVRVDRFISETSSHRKLNIDLVRNSHKGLKVPLKSMRDIDLNKMTAKIVLVKANCATIREVKIEGKNDEYAIISSLNDDYGKGVSLYDTFVINHENVEEGQIIKK